MTELSKTRSGSYRVKNPTEEGLNSLRTQGYRLQKNETRKEGTNELLGVNWLAATPEWVESYKLSSLTGVKTMDFND